MLLFLWLYGHTTGLLNSFQSIHIHSAFFFLASNGKRSFCRRTNKILSRFINYRGPPRVYNSGSEVLFTITRTFFAPLLFIFSTFSNYQSPTIATAGGDTIDATKAVDHHEHTSLLLQCTMRNEVVCCGTRHDFFAAISTCRLR